MASWPPDSPPIWRSEHPDRAKSRFLKKRLAKTLFLSKSQNRSKFTILAQVGPLKTFLTLSERENFDLATRWSRSNLEPKSRADTLINENWLSGTPPAWCVILQGQLWRILRGEFELKRRFVHFQHPRQSPCCVLDRLKTQNRPIYQKMPILGLFRQISTYSLWIWLLTRENSK